MEQIHVRMTLMPQSTRLSKIFRCPQSGAKKSSTHLHFPVALSSGLANPHRVRPQSGACPSKPAL
jgi:hypothetical protein